jgi:hypothetical protein
LLRHTSKKQLVKNCFTLLLALLVLTNAFSKPVNESTAKMAAQSFLKYKSKSPALQSLTDANLQLAYQTFSKTGLIKDSATLFYVFNVAAAKGFVIVSGDDNAMPVLAYSDEHDFDSKKIPVSVAKWLEGYKSQLRTILGNTVQQNSAATSAWEELLNPSNISKNREQNAVVVAPIMQTKWDQSPYYNAFCPTDYDYQQQTVTGCVATAMAQIMKRWNYPANGAGFHSYNTQKYGTLSANFGSTGYQWNAMPNMVNSANSAVATLMYQVGVSVDMNYGVGETGGSGAYVINAQSPVINCAEYAFKTYFGYDKTLQGIERKNYSDAQWITLLKTELNANRPVLYAGFGSGGGHCFVTDGYDDNNYFHFNWGWSGAYDGYFTINALNPGGVGTGGGSGGFNSGHQAVIGIKPGDGSGGGGTGTDVTDLRLYDDIVVSTNTQSNAVKMYYAEAFKVTAAIGNYGTKSFSGDYCAAIFDADGYFVDFVDSATLTLPSLKGGVFEFSSDGLFSVLPGTYQVGIFYRPTGGQWVLVADNSEYHNLKQLGVVNGNDIEMYSDMTVTPGLTLIKGQPASVRLNILNDGTSNFLGNYNVGLYNLDGSFVQTINTVTESQGLPPGYAYVSPFLNFSTSAITAEPGTYLLAVQHKRNGSTSYELTGSSYYHNPIKVTVKAPAIQPDIYEVNNTPAQAKALPAGFTGNTASVKTTGSNCHVGSDYDYYKIELPAGYNYSISARLHDAYNSSNGTAYTLDALFSDSIAIAGSRWSDAYDDVSPGAVSLLGGGTIYFKVSPYFTGEIGTYLLDVTVTREQAAISIYTFTGNGNWDNAANWLNGAKPPTTLSSGQEIIINPQVGGECILNVSQTVPAGAKFTVKPNAKFRVVGGLKVTKTGG